MDWKELITTELRRAWQATQSDPGQMAVRLEEAIAEIKSVRASLDEQVLVGARSGVRHLIDGMNSDVPAVRNDEFVMARQDFSRLVELDPAGITAGTSDSIENRYLICLGYLGNFYYFLLRQDWKSSAIQVYECTAAYPNIALGRFPPGFFARPYLSLLGEKGKELQRAQDQFAERRRSNFWSATKYYTKQTGRVAASAVVALGGAVLGLVATGLFPPASYALMAGGLKAANDVYEKMDVKSPELLDVDGPRGKITGLMNEIAGLWRDLKAESDARRTELQHFTAGALFGEGDSYEAASLTAGD